MFWFIIALIEFILLGAITWFVYDYASKWPTEKEDFDQHMTEIYNKIQEYKNKKK